MVLERFLIINGNRRRKSRRARRRSFKERKHYDQEPEVQKSIELNSVVFPLLLYNNQYRFVYPPKRYGDLSPSVSKQFCSSRHEVGIL
jgi:hypothetical protein